MFYFVLTGYIVGVLIFLVFAGVIIYHLLRFGFIGDATKGMVFIFVVVGLVIIVFATIHVFTTEWQSLNLINVGSQNSQDPAPAQPSKPIFSNE